MVPSRARWVWITAAVAWTSLAGACGLDVVGTRGGDAAAPPSPEGSSSGSSGSSGGPGDSGNVDSTADSGALDTGLDASDASDASDAADAAPVVIPDFAWYLLNETAGTTASDSTSNNYDITNLTNVVWGSGATFNGANAGGSRTVPAALRQAPVSITAWVIANARADRTANNFSVVPFPPNAVSGDVPGQYGYGIGLNVWTDGTPGSALGVENVGYTFTNDGGAFVSGTEYFIATTISSGAAQVYVNARLVGQAVPTQPGAAATTTLRLGLHNDDTNYGTKRFFKGRLRDVRVYKRVITAAEVQALFTKGPATSL
jgi:hypothetical protein